MKLKEIEEILDEISPPVLAEGWDNVGLLAGDPEQSVRNVLLTIDLTAEVLAEAKGHQADLIVAYHPPIFQPLKRVIKGQGPSSQLYETIRSGIAIYSMHTGLDCVQGGVNDLLAEIVGIVEPQPLKPSEMVDGKKFKLVVFVPQSDLARVSEAIFSAGAGRIGNYSKCSFRSDGTGTFEGSSESTPTIGRKMKFEQTPELRLETIINADCLEAVVAAMRKAHSYEEVAYDLYPLAEAAGHVGLGRLGDLKKAQSKTRLLQIIKQKLKIKTIGLIGSMRGSVTRAAVCAGSGGSLVDMVIAGGCDFYLTGELNHHNALKLNAAKITTVTTGHSNSERVILPKVASTLRKRCDALTVRVSRKDKDPFQWC